MKSLANDPDHNEIVRRLKTLHPESPKAWGRMSGGQVLCHLADSLRIGLGDIAAPRRTTWLERHLVKWIALQTPMRWPEGSKTMPQADTNAQGTQPTAFEHDLETLIGLLVRFRTDGQLGNFPHPLFGTMTRAEWLRWAYLHNDHHLRQFGA